MGSGHDVRLPYSLAIAAPLAHSCFSSSMTGLINGGLSGTIYTYICGTFGMSCVILSMAEMASM